MALEITIAIIAILGTIIGGFLNYLYSKKNQKEIELLRSHLDEKKAEKDAWRDYLYDAKKRLYNECEPFFFLFSEMTETAMTRILSLARMARDGDLGVNGKLANWDEYFFKSTLYRFLAPLTNYKLMQRRLTLVDLSVDPKIKIRYDLMKFLYWSFSNDFELANISPKLKYKPNESDAGERRESEPEKYWRQGLATGRVDTAVESLIKNDSSKIPYCMSYVEFEEKFEDKKFRKNFIKPIEIFNGFHPKTRPVLWRILIQQYYLYMAFKQACNTKESSLIDDFRPIGDISKIQREKFDWRSNDEEASDREVLEEPFEAAKKFLSSYFSP